MLHGEGRYCRIRCFGTIRAVSTYDANVYSLQEMNSFPCQMFRAHRQSPTLPRERPVKLSPAAGCIDQ
jgi:hypothetical protein